MILLVTNRNDLTCDFVVRELRRRGISFWRLNTEEFPTQGYGTVRIGRTDSMVLRWKNRDVDFDFSQVRSVWYRRPIPPEPPEAIADEKTKKLCVEESSEFVRGVLSRLNCYWMSDPDAIHRSEHKLYQLAVARHLGFTVPDTLCSNDPEEIGRFFIDCDRQMVVKALYTGYVDDKDNPSQAFTSVVRDEDLGDLASAELCPSIYQRLIDKAADLRVTVVGDCVFAAEIRIREESGVPDWRFYGQDGLENRLYSLPAGIEELCLELVRSLGLDFGAIDIALAKDGEHHFLEINPNGQWAWLEIQLGLPIASAIAERLHRKSVDRAS